MKFDHEDISEMEREIGHKIPRPYSQTLLEDLEAMPESEKVCGRGVRLLAMAKHVHGD